MFIGREGLTEHQNLSVLRGNDVRVAGCNSDMVLVSNISMKDLLSFEIIELMTRLLEFLVRLFHLLHISVLL